MSRYKLVIFNLDGVICNTDIYHFLAWKKIANELHIPFDEQLNDSLRFVRRIESLNIITEHFGEEISDEKKEYYAEKKNSIYRKYLEGLSEADLNPGVKETTDLIKAKGIMIAVASLSNDTKFMLNKLGLEDYFDDVANGGDVAGANPEPEILMKICLRLDVVPRNCLIVENSDVWVKAALSNGMDCAAMGMGVNYSLARYYLNKFEDLIYII